jgi:serine phosphatase RsbU (regulator of sigma subunit)
LNVLSIMNKIVISILILIINFYAFSQDSWENVRNNKKGTVVLNYFNSENFISDQSGILKGIEYEIFIEFKNYIETTHHVDLTVKYKKSTGFSDLYNLVKNGKSGDFGACSFSITDKRKQEVRFSPKYMSDIEVLITSGNLPIFKDTAEFLKYSKQTSFLIVPNTTYEEDFNNLSVINNGFNVEKIGQSSIINDRVSNEDNLMAFTELPTYFISLKNGKKFKRQNLFRVERNGYGFIFPKKSDWNDVIQDFFYDDDSKIKINEILKKYLGDDINDLLLKLSTEYNDEVLLLTKEKELQEAELDLNALTIENNTLEKNKTEADQLIIEEKHLRDKLYLYFSIAFIGFIAVFSLIAYKNKSKANNIIAEQKLAVEEKNVKIELQHRELELTHHEISSSIKYAERLQLAILPPTKDLEENLSDGFVLFKPKDVVSGDFYWLQITETHSLLAVADCTGHGVPGAMVSVVCSNCLNRSVKEFKLSEPADILNKTRELVIETFARSGKDIKDGMDISLVAFKDGYVTFSGANNPLWVIRDITLITEEQKAHKSTVIQKNRAIISIKACRQPVGLYEDMYDFTQTDVQLYKDDYLYLFTDGYADQFGGPDNKKMKPKPFKKLLLSINHLEMNEQRKKLVQNFNNWKGDFEQIDDVCIIGIKA